ncbi:hypothetical protein GCM10025864_25390 [Luteimicrobium album]|uniref:Beta-glucosidase n=1 Tax=Luteimicrobium album TaxID=1054550 RepID=A0ABQ6I4S0_9MICO|nr:hypothetical protein GCM10025864_25390 [Luteimicrobium album]
MTTTTDPALDVAALVEQLTLEEKAALLGGSDVWRTTPVERLGIGKIWLSDGPHGLRAQAEDGDHLGLLAADPAVAFPPAAALASTWDADLLTRVGSAIGEEARAKGVSVVLGPGVNMKRSPLCGRNFEYFSEDPRLAGTVGAAFVQGVQSQGVGTSLKHFAANNQETDRMSVSADVDERTLREIYLPAFERVVTQAQPWTVMCSYNRINGVFASQDRWLLTDVLRDEWGFQGVVVSDWGAVLDREKAVHAGLDLEMPSSGGFGTQRVLDAVAAGELSLADVDLAVTRVLELVAKSQPALTHRPAADLDAHHALAREAATRSAVLLQNDGVLPLDPASSGTVAVVGELARTPRFQGGGSSQVTPTRVDAALPALQDVLGERVVFAAGYALDDDAPAETTAALRDEAVAAARDAEVVVLFLGLPDAYESEGFDRAHMHLPPQQLALLDALAEAGARVVVVLSNGSVVEVAPWRARAAAILETWLLGQAGAAPSPTCCWAAPTRRGGSPRPSRCATRTTPRSGTSPARPGTSATARVCSSATAGTTRAPSRSRSRSATACRTRRSRTPASPSRCSTTAPPRACASPSP